MMAAARRVAEADRFLRAGRFRRLGDRHAAGPGRLGRHAGLSASGASAAPWPGGPARSTCGPLTDASPCAGRRAELAATRVELTSCWARPTRRLHVPLTAETRHLIGAPSWPHEADGRAGQTRVARWWTSGAGRGPPRRAVFAAASTVRARAEVHPDLLAGERRLAPHIAAGRAHAVEMSVLAVRNLLAGLRGDRRPTAQPGRARPMIRLLAVDLDGTLISVDLRSTEGRRGGAAREAAAAVVACTGRPFPGAVSSARRRPACAPGRPGSR